MKQAIILGAGGTGRDVAGFIERINAVEPTYELLGYLDDDTAKQRTTIDGVSVLGPLETALRRGEAAIFDALGSPRNFRERRAIIESLQIPAQCFEPLVHPTAVIAGSCTIGPGCLVYPLTMLGPDVSLGEHVILLSHSVVHHDSIVGGFTIIASGVSVSGGVKVGGSCYLGAGCSIREGITVGEGALVGMGSVVVSDVPAGAVVAGNPARRMDS